MAADPSRGDVRRTYDRRRRDRGGRRSGRARFDRIALRVGTIIGFQNPPAWRTDWHALYADGLDFAVAAEDLGLDEVWLTEHHFAEDGYCPALLPVAAAIAARTTRVRIGTKVLLMPFHDPVRLAEDVAIVDILSGGRLDVGIAAGYRPEEFAGFGINHRDRGARTQEGVRVLELALSGAPFSFDGRFHHYESVTVTPPPVQQPVPIWIGGRSELPLRRAAAAGHHLQLADFDPELCARDCSTYIDALLEHGRDPCDYEIVAVASVFVDDDSERARALALPHLLYQQRLYQRWFSSAGDRSTEISHDDDDQTLPPGCLVGTPEEVLEQVAAVHVTVPFTHFSFWTLLPGMQAGIARRSLELFARDVMPGLCGLS